MRSGQPRMRSNDSPSRSGSARRLGSMLFQQPVELCNPEPFGRVFGKALHAAVGPEPAALGLHVLTIQIGHGSSPSTRLSWASAPARGDPGVHFILVGQLAPACKARGVERPVGGGGTDRALRLVAVRAVGEA